MRKLSKEQLKELMSKNILDCTKEELEFLFHIFDFDLKEFQQGVDGIIFEVHFKLYYVMKVSASPDSLSFRNQWINFTEEAHGLAMNSCKTVTEVLVIFINMFGPTIFPKLNYEVVYDPERSCFDSLEEATEYLELLRKTADKIVSIS